MIHTAQTREGVGAAHSVPGICVRLGPGIPGQSRSDRGWKPSPAPGGDRRLDEWRQCPSAMSVRWIFLFLCHLPSSQPCVRACVYVCGLGRETADWGPTCTVAAADYASRTRLSAQGFGPLHPQRRRLQCGQRDTPRRRYCAPPSPPGIPFPSPRQAGCPTAQSECGELLSQAAVRTCSRCPCASETKERAPLRPPRGR